jgi:hypothetical protein
VSVGCLLSELSGTDEVTLVGTESHSESCTTHGVCKAIVEVAKDGYSANPSPIAAKLPVASAKDARSFVLPGAL